MTQWPDSVDEILNGDHAVALAYVTPAEGVVLLPVSNFALHDRANSVVTVNSSVGAWRKLDRMRHNPHVAIAFHTRTHATHDRPEYVLVQGRASLQPPVADYPGSIVDNWERIEPWRNLGPLWKRWMKVYALRVEVRIAVERVIVWPSLDCRSPFDVHGAPLPAEPPRPQDPPAKGTAPRMDQARVARQAARLPNALLGWVGADGFPVVIAVQVGAADDRGVLLEVPEGLVPPGGRRAGFTAHWFSRGVVGQRQRIHTGWLDAPAGASAVTYSPHTKAGYRMPNSRFVYRIAAGLATRMRYRQARRAGVDWS